MGTEDEGSAPPGGCEENRRSMRARSDEGSAPPGRRESACQGNAPPEGLGGIGVSAGMESAASGEGRLGEKVVTISESEGNAPPGGREGAPPRESAASGGGRLEVGAVESAASGANGLEAKHASQPYGSKAARTQRTPPTTEESAASGANGLESAAGGADTPTNAASGATASLTSPRALEDRFSEYLTHSRAENTFKAYAEDWKGCIAWLAARGLPPSGDPAELSPAHIAQYLTSLDLAGKRVSTIKRAWFGIKYALRGRHEWASSRQTPEVIATVLGSVARLRQEKPAGKKAVTPGELARMVDLLEAEVAGPSDALRSARDSAILLVGWYAMLRRGELSALEVTDLAFEPRGMRVTIRHSKTDQAGKGLEKPVFFASNPTYCPVLATKRWLERAGLVDERAAGPLFRPIPRGSTCVGDEGMGGTAIWAIVKKACSSVGLDPATYGAHSLRAGGITASAAAGKPLEQIMKVSGHRSVEQLLEYVRPATLFENEATKDIGPK